MERNECANKLSFPIWDLVTLSQCQGLEHNQMGSLFSRNLSLPSESCKHNDCSGILVISREHLEVHVGDTLH
jgi:hypothetical protein